MSLYNFQPRFVEPILAGEKRHTIRLPRLRQDKPGDIMHLYVGLRHKGARLLFRAPCVKVETIVVWPNRSDYAGIWIAPGAPLPGGLSKIGWGRLAVEGASKGFSILTPAERDAFANSDGFASWADMYCYWQMSEGGLPFYGGIYSWDYDKRSMEKRKKGART